MLLRRIISVVFSTSVVEAIVQNLCNPSPHLFSKGSPPSTPTPVDPSVAVAACSPLQRRS